MLFYPATLSLSSRTLIYAAEIIRRHRRQIESAWRKLTADRQALLVLAYLRKRETFAGLRGRDDHQQRLRCSQGVARDRIEPPTFRFQVERMPRSSLMCWEYAAVYGCARSLTAAVVAVTVAVGDTSGPPACEATSQVWVNPSPFA